MGEAMRGRRGRAIITAAAMRSAGVPQDPALAALVATVLAGLRAVAEGREVTTGDAQADRIVATLVA